MFKKWFILKKVYENHACVEGDTYERHVSWLSIYIEDCSFKHLAVQLIHDEGLEEGFYHLDDEIQSVKDQAFLADVVEFGESVFDLSINL